MSSQKDSPKSSAYPWVGADDEQYLAYMSDEWGVPVHNDRKLFEMLALECFQAGLSWAIVLKRRSALRRAFANFNVSRVARFDAGDRQRLLDDKDIIRNKRKIEAVIKNANAVLAVIKEFGSFSEYLWSFVNGTPIKRNKNLRNWEDLPNRSPESEKLARDMKKRGFAFVGPISCYAFMQATGLVDDRINASCNPRAHRVES